MVLRTAGGSFVRKSLPGSFQSESPPHGSNSLLVSAAGNAPSCNTDQSSTSSPPRCEPPVVLSSSFSSILRRSSSSAAFGSFCSVVTEFSCITPPLGSPREAPMEAVKPYERTWGDDVIRFVVISDTHCRHDALLSTLPPGDVLVHAGDFTSTGATPQVENFCDFLKRCHHETKVVIAGNHDITLHEEYYEAIGEERFHRGRRDGPYFPAQCRRLLTGLSDSHQVRYLDNSECDLQGGGAGGSRAVKVWGSPWTPYYQNWAFNYAPGSEECRRIWGSCPSGVDVLITHGPPLGVGDMTYRKVRAGCPDLLREVRSRIRPRVHIFGHIHEGYGVYRDDHGITYINASTSTVQYHATNAPLVFDLPLDPSLPVSWVSDVSITHLPDLDEILMMEEEKAAATRNGGHDGDATSSSSASSSSSSLSNDATTTTTSTGSSSSSSSQQQQQQQALLPTTASSSSLLLSSAGGSQDGDLTPWSSCCSSCGGGVTLNNNNNNNDHVVGDDDDDDDDYDDATCSSSLGPIPLELASSSCSSASTDSASSSSSSSSSASLTSLVINSDSSSRASWLGAADKAALAMATKWGEAPPSSAAVAAARMAALTTTSSPPPPTTTVVLEDQQQPLVSDMQQQPSLSSPSSIVLVIPSSSTTTTSEQVAVAP